MKDKPLAEQFAEVTAANVTLTARVTELEGEVATFQEAEKTRAAEADKVAADAFYSEALAKGKTTPADKKKVVDAFIALSGDARDVFRTAVLGSDDKVKLGETDATPPADETAAEREESDKLYRESRERVGVEAREPAGATR